MDKEPIKRFAKHTCTVWRWFIWGLRWLAIVVFTLLLLAGIAVKLPWKVLVCLAIIPVVGVFVPKRVQPWVWMGLTIILLGAWLWVKLPGGTSGPWRPYQFDAELAGLEATRAVDPSANAAIRYQALFDTYDESIFSYPHGRDKVETHVFDTTWTADDDPLMAEWLARYHPGIDTLGDIARMDECRFPIPQTLETLHAQMKRINQMKGWTNLLLWSGNLDLAEGRTERAVEKYRTVLGMARHLYQQQNLFDQASAFYLELHAARAFQTYIIDHGDDPDTLTAIADAFAQLDTGWAKSWTTIVDCEKLLVKNIMGLFYETDSDGHTRIARSAMYAMQEGLGFRPRPLFIRQHEMNRLAVIGLWLSLPTKPQRLAGLIDERFDHYSLLTQKGVPLPTVPIQYSWRAGLNIRSAIDWLAVDKVKYFWALHGQDMRHRAVTEQMRLFAALKTHYLRHGDWPESLTALERADIIRTDSVYNKPYVYRRTPGGFTLYSLGPNGIDDNGVNDPRQNKDDIVLWPRPADAEHFDEPLGIEKKP